MRLKKGMGLMEKYGTYIVWQVWWLMEENGTTFFFMNGSKCERRCLFSRLQLKGFQIFYLVGRFVMGMLWWLIFRGDKEGIFFNVLL